MTTPPIPTTPPAPPPMEPVRPYQPMQYSEPQGFFQRTVNRLPYESRNVNVPNGVPRILGSRPIVFNAWMISMVIVGFDEWHNLHILPRPKRLWSTSLFYGMLVMVSVADPLVPLANAFAIGYTLTLLWQYYNGGITPDTGKKEPNAGAATQANQTGNLTPGGAVTSSNQINQAALGALQRSQTHGGVQ